MKSENQENLVFQNEYITDHFVSKLEIYNRKIKYKEQWGLFSLNMETQHELSYSDINRVRPGRINKNSVVIKTKNETIKIRTSAPKRVTEIIDTWLRDYRARVYLTNKINSLKEP